jgi:hypothetical protein
VLANAAADPSEHPSRQPHIYARHCGSYEKEKAPYLRGPAEKAMNENGLSSFSRVGPSINLSNVKERKLGRYGDTDTYKQKKSYLSGRKTSGSFHTAGFLCSVRQGTRTTS